MLYQILLTLHLFALIAWMAGLFYLPRLFVYHADAQPDSSESDTFAIMERRLLRAIMNPAMIATWVFGLWLALEGGHFFGAGWLHAKIALVLALSGFHGACASWRRAFAEGRNKRPAGFYRVFNEIPTLLLIGILILVVFKPF